MQRLLAGHAVSYNRRHKRHGQLFQNRYKRLHNRKRKTKEPGQGRDVVCYWAVIELGEPVIDVARRFDITPSTIGYAVQREEKIVKKGDLRLIDYIV